MINFTFKLTEYNGLLTDTFYFTVLADNAEKALSILSKEIEIDFINDDDGFISLCGNFSLGILDEKQSNRLISLNMVNYIN